MLATDPAFDRVVGLARRPLPRELAQGNVESHVVDFDNLGAHASLFHVDQILCALGTTIRQAGTQEAFRVVDYHYPLTAARLGHERGATHFLLVSALGADARSRVFYSRVKGELEAAVLALPYRSVTIVRPSLLLGPRAEYRLGEQIAKRLAFLVPAKYKPVDAHAVAAALVRAAKQDAPGRRIIESREIRALASAAAAAG
ncbi:MAG: oxidoreductase [Gemmatimonadota bacterium]|nr:oxidoreductase [Gemmatimonadota bacterium]